MAAFWLRFAALTLAFLGRLSLVLVVAAVMVGILDSPQYRLGEANRGEGRYLAIFGMVLAVAGPAGWALLTTLT